jgi:hypothetical protein
MIWILEYHIVIRLCVCERFIRKICYATEHFSGQLAFRSGTSHNIIKMGLIHLPNLLVKVLIDN